MIVRENAKWYINTVKMDQSDDEFDATGRPEVQKFVLADPILTKDRDLKRLRLLEIGCGIGRMTKHLAEAFGRGSWHRCFRRDDQSGAWQDARLRERISLRNQWSRFCGVARRLFRHDLFGLRFSARAGRFSDPLEYPRRLPRTEARWAFQIPGLWHRSQRFHEHCPRTPGPAWRSARKRSVAPRVNPVSN